MSERDEFLNNSNDLKEREEKQKKRTSKKPRVRKKGSKGNSKRSDF